VALHRRLQEIRTQRTKYQSYIYKLNQEEQEILAKRNTTGTV
jgi:hypothetical protein